jgi:hypothetical protein
VIEDLSLSQKKRKRNALRKENKILQDVDKQYDALLRHIHKLANDRRESLTLWMSTELQQGGEWFLQGLEIVPAMMKYYAGNWLKSTPAEVFNSLQELDGLSKTILVRGAGNPIKEDEMENYLLDVQYFVELQKRVKPLLVDLLNRFDQVQELEKENITILQKTDSLLKRLLPVIHSNPHLKKIAGSEPEKFSNRVREMLIEFQEVEIDTVEKKAKKTSQVLEQLKRNLQAWIKSMQGENCMIIQKLRENYRALTQDVLLEDAVVFQIGKFLEQNLGEDQDFGSALDSMSLLDLGKVLIKNSETWQNSISFGKAVQDIASPVLERLHKVEKSRQLVADLLERGNLIMPETLKWPPTTQQLINERRLFLTYDEQWFVIRQTKTQALVLVTKLSDLAENFQSLIASLKIKLDIGEKELAKVREYESRLDESKDLWLKVIALNKGNRQLEKDINRLLMEIDQDFRELQRKYEKGGLPYQQALNSLRLLCRKADDTLVPISEIQTGEGKAGSGRVVDINGVMQKRNY